MRRKRLVLTVIVILLAVGLFIFLQPSRAILGTLRGEAFLLNHPASYWGQQLMQGPQERSNAVASINKAGSAAVDVLRELLTTHAEPDVRLTAAELLGKMGPEAHAASDDLIAATTDSDPHVRALAAVAIPAVNTPPDEGIPPLVTMLNSEHAAIAARAISVYREDAKPALAALERLMRDETKEIEMRWNAARSLGKLGPAGIDALPLLIEFTTHPDETLREHAAEAIGDIGPTAAAGIPALRECLDDPATKVRRDAVRSLGYLGSAAMPAISDILPLLEDPEEIVRKAALDALQKIDPSAVSKSGKDIDQVIEEPDRGV